MKIKNNNMSKEKIENIYKYFLGVTITLILGVLSIIATLQYYSSIRFEKFAVENTKEHSELKQNLAAEKSYTSNIYKYEIQPNTVACKKIRKELDSLKLDVKKNYSKIREIERKIK